MGEGDKVMNINDLNLRILNCTEVLVVKDVGMMELGLIIGAYDVSSNIIYVNTDMVDADEQYYPVVVLHELLHVFMGHAGMKISDLSEDHLHHYMTLEYNVDKLVQLLCRHYHHYAPMDFTGYTDYGVSYNSLYIWQWAKKVMAI
jgi:hypothetical protein